MNPSVETDLKRRVSSGVFWAGGARISQQGFQFLLSVVLARLLLPEDYGLMAMAMLFTGFAGILADAGLNAAVVQRKELTEIHTNTIFWSTIGSGVALTALTFVLSTWLANFFKAPALALILRIISLNFTLGSVGNVPSALLQRTMQFRKIAQIDVASLVLSGIAAVVAALLGAGVWSLVIQSLAASLLRSFFRCWSCGWVPKLIFSGSAFRDIWGFSGHLYGFNFINYWTRNADNLLIGRFFNAAALGYYNRAYALMLLPITQVNSVITQVLFPTLSSIQSDKARVKRIYLRSIGVATLLTFPVMFGLAVTAGPFVQTVYGAKWAGVSPLLQILALVGAMQVLVNSTGWLFLSQGRTDAMLRWGICLSAVMVTSFVIGVMLGSVRALAICYAIANAAFLLPGMAVALHLVDSNLKELLSSLSWPFFASSTMAILVASIRLALPADWIPWETLAVLAGSGAVIYAVSLYVFRPVAWADLLRLMAGKRGASPTPQVKASQAPIEPKPSENQLETTAHAPAAPPPVSESLKG